MRKHHHFSTNNRYKHNKVLYLQNQKKMIPKLLILDFK